MAASDLLASSVMNTSASLLNDSVRSVYTYTAQLPYLKLAIQELQEHFVLNGIPSTEQVSAVITVPLGTVVVGYNGVLPTPTLPSDMVEISQVWERAFGTDLWTPMIRRDRLPVDTGNENSSFNVYTWQDQKIKLVRTNRANELKLDYLRQLFPDNNTITQDTQINIINGASFLEYRTAALCAEFIERNGTSAVGLNSYASLAIDRATGIGVKSKQTIMSRRRPFRSGYKRMG